MQSDVIQNLCMCMHYVVLENPDLVMKEKETLFGLFLCRRFVWTVPASSSGARPVPGVCASPAQTSGSPQRPDGER